MNGLRMGRRRSPAEVKADELLELVEKLSVEVAALRGERSTLELERRLESLAEERRRALDELAAARSEAARVELDVEHKLGLHHAQVDSERRLMQAEAESERKRAVDEARLAVREENLGAERARFEQEVRFRTERFEAEAATLRDLTKQILERLPNVTATFAHTVSDRPRALPAAPVEGEVIDADE